MDYKSMFNNVWNAHDICFESMLKKEVTTYFKFLPLFNFHFKIFM